MLPRDDIKDAKKRPMPFYNKVVLGAHFYYDFLSPIDDLEAFYTLLLLTVILRGVFLLRLRSLS